MELRAGRQSPSTKRMTTRRLRNRAAVTPVAPGSNEPVRELALPLLKVPACNFRWDLPASGNCSPERGGSVMNALVPFDPIKEMRDLQSRFSLLYNRLPVKGEKGKEESLTPAELMPPVAIVEDEK